MTREIPLGKYKGGSGMVAIVDEQDYQELSKYSWYPNKMHNVIYASRAVRIGKGKYKHVQMHRQILQVDGYENKCDHINGNGLDNRRCNLRVCSHKENIRNRQNAKVLSNCGFKGVTRHNDRFVATIRADGMTFREAGFKTAKEAAEAYDRLAKTHHKEFASTNF